MRSLLVGSTLILLFGAVSSPLAADTGPGGGDDDGDIGSSGSGDDGDLGEPRGPPAPLPTPPQNGSRDDDDDGGDDDADDDRSGRAAQASSSRSRDDDDEDDDDDDGDDDGRRGGENGSRRADVQQNFNGRFTLQDASASGRFVVFRVADGGIQAYRCGNVTLFDRIAYSPALDAERVEAKGAVFEAEGEGRFRAFDNPTCHFRARAQDDGALTFSVPANVSIGTLGTENASGVNRLLLQGPSNLTGFISSEDPLTIDDGRIVGSHDVRFTVHAPGLRGDRSGKIDAAVDDGRLAAEIIVHRARGEGPRALALQHGPVDVQIDDRPGALVLTVSGEGPGRALLVNLERDALGRIEDLVVRFDGENISQADDLDDVLRPGQGEGAEYLIIVGRTATQVLIGVPHFSVHTIELSSFETQGSFESIVAGPVGSAAAFVLAALATAAFVAGTWAWRSRLI